MDKIFDLNTVLKNRFLILSCAVLILGTVFGTSMLKFLPEEVLKNLFGFLSNRPSDFMNEFINKLSFPLLILISLYFSGSGIFGSFTAPFLVFIYGAFYGFENSLNYMFYGADYIVSCMISFFTGTFFYGFAILLMSENSIFSSKSIMNCIKGKSEEKPHYNAKKQAVKLVAFTACFAIISVFSAFISLFVRSRG